MSRARTILESDDDRLDAAISALGSFDSIETDVLARYVAWTRALHFETDGSIRTTLFHLLYRGSKALKNSSREELIEEITEEFGATPEKVVQWAKTRLQKTMQDA